MHREDLHGDLLFLIHDFFSEVECRRSIAFSEGQGYADAPLTTALGFVMAKEVRNNTRVMVDVPALAAEMFARARPFLPERVDPCRLHGLNERLRFYRYDVGQRFGLHYDGSFRRNAEEESQLTFMIYLNDDFSGGTTDFYYENFRLKARVRPRRGMALVFAHAQLHEGTPVTGGRKYVLRSDVMYRVVPAAALRATAGSNVESVT
jgi:predicted 2-oxoglutarate/Fe(II)-dependent dioxygenase YbiX